MSDEIGNGQGCKAAGGMDAGSSLPVRWYVHSFAIRTDGTHDSMLTRGFDSLALASEWFAECIVEEMVQHDDDMDTVPAIVREALVYWDSWNEVYNLAWPDDDEASERIAEKVALVAHAGLDVTLRYRGLGLDMQAAR